MHRVNTEISVSDELYNFINDLSETSYSLQIILFFTEHPRARFNELAIIHGLGESGSRIYIKKALGELVKKGVLQAIGNNSIPIYSLAEDQSLRNLIFTLAKLDIHQRQTLVAHPLAKSREGKSQNETEKNIINDRPEPKPVTPEKTLKVGKSLAVTIMTSDGEHQAG